MAVCNVCKRRFLLRGLNRRLAMPEYRSVIGFWPWVGWRVCDSCLEAYDRDFRERLALLVPDVVDNDEPVVGRVCLACGKTDPGGSWQEASKWVDAAGRPVRRCRWRLCAAHRDQVYVDGIIVTSNLTDAARLGAVIDELPLAGADLVERVEAWRPGTDLGPAGAADVAPERSRDQAAADAWAFWRSAGSGLEARAAWLGPIRKDYRMRYRLDLVLEMVSGRRDVLTVLRTGHKQFTTYRTSAHLPAPPDSTRATENQR